MSTSYVTLPKLITAFRELKLTIISPQILASIYPGMSQNSRYAIIKRLKEKHLIEAIKPGLYSLLSNPPTVYQIAQLMVSPSYISLETALNYYGILSQFPHSITSVTVGKARIITREVTYSYAHIKPSLFHSYQLVDGALMATKEKALIDYLYLAAKGLRNTNIDEFDLSSINRQELTKYPWSQSYA